MNTNQLWPGPLPEAGFDREAILSDGLTRLNAGDLNGAEEVIRRVLRRNKSDPDALHLLGLCQHLNGNDSGSIKLIKKAIKRGGANPLFLNNLGQIQAKAGKHIDAVRSFQSILKSDPKNFEVRTNLANALASLGRNDDAVHHYRLAVDAAPSYAPAHYNLGILYLDAGDAGQALACFQGAVALEPNYLAAHNNLGLAYLALDDPARAAGCFEHALTLDPVFIDALKNLGAAYSLINREEDVIGCFERVLAIDDTRADIHLHLGDALGIMGRFDQAESAYRRAIQLQPNNAKAYQMLGEMNHFADDGSDIHAMEELLANGTLSDVGKTDLLHALFMAYDQKGAVDRAFACLKDANDRTRQTCQFDIEEERLFHVNLKQIYTEETLSKMTGKGFPADSPVFIVGMPRSGSTLIEQILASHPKVHGAGESRELLMIGGRFESLIDRHLSQSEIIENISDDDLWKLGSDYLAALAPRTDGAVRIVDKQLQNYKNVGLINMILPNARIIHSRRDPRAVCFSCYKSAFTDIHKYTHNLEELGATYHLYSDLMNHWRRVSQVPILDVDYEKLVADQENETRRILEFCGLEWNDACLDFHATKRAVSTASLYQVRQPLYRSSVKQWERYREHLGELLEAIEPITPNKH